MRLFFLLITFLASLVMATHVAVLETVAEENAKDSVSLTDRRYLTNVLREQAVQLLPVEQNFVIMTRDNISVMLPPGMALEDCEGSCLAETGRNISADFICQARVGKFGGMLTLSAELYETAGNKLIASFNGRGADVNELLALIEQKSPDFFRRVKDLAAPPLVKEAEVEAENVRETDSVNVVSVSADTAKPVAEVTEPATAKSEEVKPEESNADDTRVKAAAAYNELDGKEGSPKVGESVPTNIDDESAKKGGIRWIPLSIGAVVTAVGVTAAIVGNQKAKEESEKTYTTAEEYEKYHQNAKDYQTTRTVGTIIAIVGAIGIGLSIAF